MRHIDPNHPYQSLGQIHVYEEGDQVKPHQSMRLAEMEGISYYDLEDVLGSPTYSRASADGKVNREWRIKYIPRDCEDTPDFYLFAIYDWKTESEWETMNKLREWSIGGERGSNHIARELAELITKLNHIKEL